VAAQQENLLKDKVAIAVKQHYGRDFKKIGHASRVARYAEQIAKAENAGLAVVLTAAYLLDVDPPGAATTTARSILERVKARPELADQVCALIAHRHAAGNHATAEARIIHDADLLARLEEQKRDRGLDADVVTQAAAACMTAACRQQADALGAG
jgi:HD superfamily phosphodiesterase